jgi:hypothetical protein
MAHRLGLALAIVVAFGCDLVVLVVSGNADERHYGWPPMATELVVGILPIVAAAPAGWLLGPTLATARLPGKFGVALAMSIVTMLLGDIAYVLGATTFSSILAGHPSTSIDVPGLVAIIVIGALFVGPFVIALATLPAAVIWVCAFRLAWRSVGSTAMG